MNTGTRDLLGAILEAVDIPHAATIGDEETRAAILTRRVVTLRVVADEGRDPAGAAAAAMAGILAALIAGRTWT